MADPLQPDLCILGMDTAGHDLAIAAARLGARVVLVTLDESSGDRWFRSGIWLGEALSSKERMIRRASEDRARSARRLRAFGVDVIEDGAAFTDLRHLQAGERIIQPRAVLIATGRCLAGLEALSNLDSSMSDLVLEEGPAMLALAQHLMRDGHDVRIIRRDGSSAGSSLSAFDEEPVTLLRDRLASEGATFLDDAADPQALRLGPDPGKLAGLRLDRAGIACDASGFPLVDACLRTSNRRVYVIGNPAAAAGEVDPGHDQIAYLLARILLKKPGLWRSGVAARIIPTNPALAMIGLSEAEARRRVGSLRISRAALPLGTQAPTGAQGLLKVIADRRGRVLGASAFGATAAETLAPWCLILARGGRIGEISLLPPLQACEPSRKIGGDSAQSALDSAVLHRLVRFMRFFG